MRSTVLDAARRAFLGISRGTLRKTDDERLMQEVAIDLTANESKLRVERFQEYGFTSVVHPPKDDNDKKIAEMLVAFVGGNRAHGCVFAIDDRRHRLIKLKNGEVAIYDDQGQKVYVKRDMILTSVPKEKKIINRVVHKEDEQRKEDEYGQDATKKKKALSRVTQDHESFTFEILDPDDETKVRTSLRLDPDGIHLFGKNLDNVFGNDVTTTAGRDVTTTAGRYIFDTAAVEITLTAPLVQTDGVTKLDRGEQIIELYYDGLYDIPATRVFAR